MGSVLQDGKGTSRAAQFGLTVLPTLAIAEAEMFNRFLNFAVFIPLAIVLIALAVANREPVAFTMDPFNPGNPGLTMELPLFAWLFMALVLGLIIGSLVTWFRQGRYRRLARERAAEVRGLRDATRPAGPALPKPQS